MTSFDCYKFKEELDSGDINGLDYLEETLIKDYKEKMKNDKSMFYTKEEYIIALFYAVKQLNICNDVYETQSHNGIGKNFNYDLYFESKALLLKELGLTSLWEV